MYVRAHRRRRSSPLRAASDPLTCSHPRQAVEGDRMRHGDARQMLPARDARKCACGRLRPVDRAGRMHGMIVD
jgi:hypothetical protein